MKLHATQKSVWHMFRQSDLPAGRQESSRSRKPSMSQGNTQSGELLRRRIKSKLQNRKRLRRTAEPVRPMGVVFQYSPVTIPVPASGYKRFVNREKLSDTFYSSIRAIRKGKKRSFRKIKQYGKKLSVRFYNGRIKKLLDRTIIPVYNAKRRRIGIMLFATGILLFLFPGVYKASVSRRSSFPLFLNNAINAESNGEPIRIDGALMGLSSDEYKPIRIVIPRVAIDVPVVEAPVTGGLWELSETSASHGQGSANPGEKGNAVIFAHARDGLFGPIRDMKNGDAVYIFTKERWFKYKIVDIKQVNPDQLEVIAPTGDETLTLFTCSGFLDSKRFIAVAKRDNTDQDK